MSAGSRVQAIGAAAREKGRAALGRGLELSNRLRLPGPSVLPVAGAVVGLYAGLAAGLFANLIGLVSGLCFGFPHLVTTLRAPDLAFSKLQAAVAAARWHPEYAVAGVPVALAALVLARVIEPGGPRDEVKKRLRILALLVMGALSLYYPLVAAAALNTAYGTHHIRLSLEEMPFWAVLLAPAAGGVLVGRMLRNHPETHGHGVPEVVVAVRTQGGGLQAEGGALKLVASSVTIGTGGSAGREGPIVYGGAAFASWVARTLGFSRKELAILMASGAGAGIAASFNAPIAGAMFAMEIILREFELKVFSPIILASVTATMVGRGVMGSAPMLERIGYEMVSGWEILAYALLGLLCGLLAYAFVRFLHHAEGFFAGRFPGRLSAFLGRRPVSIRAGIGGLAVGLLALLNGSVWGTGHDFVNLAHARQLALGFLVVGAISKLVATGITIGSGGSGGTFFPAAVFGALAGGAFGEVLHRALPHVTAASGAYAMVGMGGAVAGLNRGPLTGMMLVYELSGNYSVILPLMVTCTIASALCHVLVERKSGRVRTDADILRETPIRELMVAAPVLTEELPLREVADRLLGQGQVALPVSGRGGRIEGVVEIEELQVVWRDPALTAVLRATDVVHPLQVLSADSDLAHGLELMDREDVDAVPVSDPATGAVGLLTRSAIRRFLFRQRAKTHAAGDHAVAATEVSR